MYFAGQKMPLIMKVLLLKNKMSETVPEVEKWGKAKAEKEFIESIEPLSNSVLAEMSHRNISTIKRWRLKYKWADKRSNFWNQVRSKRADGLSDFYSENSTMLAEAHLKRYQRFSDFADLLLNNMIEQVAKADDQQKALSKVNVRDLNLILGIADRAMKGASDTVGLQVQIDANAAIRTVESMGYIVIDPTQIEDEDPNDGTIEVEAKEM